MNPVACFSEAHGKSDGQAMRETPHRLDQQGVRPVRARWKASITKFHDDENSFFTGQTSRAFPCKRSLAQKHHLRCIARAPAVRVP